VTLFRSVHVGVLLLSLGLLGCGDQDTDTVVEASDADSFNKESASSSDFCGNSYIDYQYAEQCDGGDYGEFPTCESYGFGQGNLICNSECQVEFTGCEGFTPPPESDAGANEADAGSDAGANDTEDENAGCGARPAHSPNGFMWLAGVVVAGSVVRRRRRG
jgi:hypothetical protein